MSTCHGFVIACMDFRIQQAVDDLIRTLRIQIGDFDRVTVAGGAGNMELLQYHIDLAQRLHHPDTFILTAHDGCGYGTTLASFVRVVWQVKAMLPPEDTVRAFWFFPTADGIWRWEEIVSNYALGHGIIGG